MRMFNFKPRDQRGDTIIEVMFAMAIIAVVLSASYLAASKNLQISELSKERTTASQIAETQLELLKSLKTQPANATPFCIDITKPVPIVTDLTQCKEDYYEKIITKSNLDEYTILVRWIAPGGSDTNKAEIKLYYKSYDFSLDDISGISAVVNPGGAPLEREVIVSIANEFNIGSFGFFWGTTSPPRDGVGDGQVMPGSGDPTRFIRTITIKPGVVSYVQAYVFDSSNNTYKYGRLITITDAPAYVPPPTCQDSTANNINSPLPCTFSPSNITFVVRKIPPAAGNTTPDCSSSTTLNKSGTSINLNGTNRTTDGSSSTTFSGLVLNTNYLATATAPASHQLCSTTQTVTTGAGGSTAINTEFKIIPICSPVITGYTPGRWVMGTRRSDVDGWYGRYAAFFNIFLWRFVSTTSLAPGNFMFFDSGIRDASGDLAWYHGYNTEFVSTPIYTNTCPS